MISLDPSLYAFSAIAIVIQRSTDSWLFPGAILDLAYQVDGRANSLIISELLIPMTERDKSSRKRVI